MAGHDHHHHHRRNRLSVPQRSVTFSATSASTLGFYLLHPYPSSTPTPTPSKLRPSSLNSFPSKSSQNNKSPLSFLLLFLFLRSLYSLLPFLQSSSSSFTLFPFSFLFSLLSFLLSLFFSLLSKQNATIFSLSSSSHSELKLLLPKSLLLATVFVIRFQALRYCGTAAMILTELSGNVAARFFAEGQNPSRKFYSSKVRGFCLLFTGLLFLSMMSWYKTDCFPLSAYFVDKSGFSVYPRENCLTIWPMLLPFLSGFLGYYERASMNWGSNRQLGRKQVRLITLFFATVFLFVPAAVSFFVFEVEGVGGSTGNLGWPLANTVVFGVLLSGNYGHYKVVSSKDFHREFLVTFICTIVLELFYSPELSLMGLVLCGLLLYFAVCESSKYVELGLESSEPLSLFIMKPIRHILSERKSRKIALFLLINTGYMVVEFVTGFMSNSLGLISDACHMLFDCAALAIGLYASYVSRFPANSQFNYGRGRFEVLSGYANAVFLVLIGALIVLESFERILDPQEISTNSLLTVSIGGLVVNVVGLIFFHEEHHHAHGGSCSHLHSHSHSHSDSLSCSHHQHSHDSGGLDHRSLGKHHEAVIVVSHECHEHHQDNQHYCTDSFSEDHTRKNSKCHEHHNHAHHHDPPGHTHSHNSHDCANNHDHNHHHNDHSDHHIHGSLYRNFSTSSHTEDHKGEKSHDHQCTGSRGHTHFSDRSQQSKFSSDVKKPMKNQHHHIDHNMEGIFLHVLADTMGSVGVVISTLLIKYKGWLIADPACSIFISALIVSSVIPLLRNSAEILLQRVPRAHEQRLRKAIIDVKKIKGVSGIQNLHIWSFTNTDVVGTLHLHISEDADKASIRAQVSHILQDAGIKDLTLQVECIKLR